MFVTTKIELNSDLTTHYFVDSMNDIQYPFNDIDLFSINSRTVL